jgi:hypothetical protein
MAMHDLRLSNGQRTPWFVNNFKTGADHLQHACYLTHTSQGPTSQGPETVIDDQSSSDHFVNDGTTPNLGMSRLMA